METLPPQIQVLIPVEKDVLLREIGDIHRIGGATRMLLKQLLDNFYSSEIKQCLSVSKVLLDIIWEKLNTGHWKDVHLSWRFTYSVVAFIKALSECSILSKEESSNLQTDERDCSSSKSKTISMSPRDIVKTCDMGLLMGAPILDNILTKLAKAVQEVFLENHIVENAKTSDTESKYLKNTHSEKLKDSECFRFVVSTEEENVSSDLGIISTNASICDSEKDMDATCNRSDCKRRKLLCSHEDITVPKIKACNQILHQECPSIDTFKRDYMELRRPVVIQKGIDYWPALSTRKWSLEYIKQITSHRTVPIEIGSRYTDDSWSQKLMTVGEFIEIFIERKKGEKEIGYLAQHQLFNQIPELRNDISIPTYCSISEAIDDDVDINAWFGPKGTISPLHFDPKHNLLAQVVGEKYIRLYAEEETPNIYPHSGRLLNNTSQVDVENVDIENFPEFEKASFSECFLKPGQMLYIPPKCWHYVRSLDLSFSVSFWWM